MKLKFTFLLVLSCLMVASFAQTKLISHKSHSGSTETFRLSLENNLFDIDHSNFGLVPVQVVKLDSVVFLSDSSAMQIFRETISDGGYVDSNTIWDYKRDTLINDGILNHKFPLDSIRTMLTLKREFRNPMEEVIFVYSIKTEPKKKGLFNWFKRLFKKDEKGGQDLGWYQGKNEKNIGGYFLLGSIGVIAFLSILVGFFFKKFYE